jgi:hypothetical protein
MTDPARNKNDSYLIRLPTVNFCRIGMADVFTTSDLSYISLKSRASNAVQACVAIGGKRPKAERQFKTATVLAGSF